MPDTTTDAHRLAVAINATSPYTDPDETLYAVFNGDPALEDIDTRTIAESRWTKRLVTVYRCPDGTFAAVEEDRGATERQEPPPAATAYVVEPYEVTVTKYRKPDEASRG